MSCSVTSTLQHQQSVMVRRHVSVQVRSTVRLHHQQPTLYTNLLGCEHAIAASADLQEKRLGMSTTYRSKDFSSYPHLEGNLSKPVEFDMTMRRRQLRERAESFPNLMIKNIHN